MKIAFLYVKEEIGVKNDEEDEEEGLNFPL